MQPGEEVVAREGVQLARGFPQTAGDLFLTDRRLVLVPNQYMSLGRGEPLDVPLARVRSIKAHGPFRGGTIIGCAGRKIEVVLDDGTRHTFSFFLGADFDAFYAELERCWSLLRSPDATPPSGTEATRPFPKPRRTVWFWVSVAGVLVVAAMLLVTCADMIDRW